MIPNVALVLHKPGLAQSVLRILTKYFTCTTGSAVKAPFQMNSTWRAALDLIKKNNLQHKLEGKMSSTRMARELVIVVLPSGVTSIDISNG